jgi:glycosyltransferase involved in cell wall biosynthesis
MTDPQDMVKVLYWGGNRKVYYADNFSVEWIHDFNHYKGFEPDVIIARGGFDEYVPILKMFRQSFKVYYGANHGCVPKDGIEYNLVLCDSERQKARAESHGYKAELFIKPAPLQFQPQDVEKKYDCLLAAVWPEDKRKNVKWVYKTAPKNFKILQVGHDSGMKVPSNVTIKYVEKDRMARAISKSKVVIAPYKSADSCPRIIPEAIACGVPVVALDTVNIWQSKYQVAVVPKADFWGWVKTFVKNYEILKSEIRAYHEENLSAEKAGRYLKNLIERCRHE